MKTSVERSALLFLLACLIAPTSTRAQDASQTASNDELARRIVTTSVNIKPGEVVVVSGGRHTIALMESIAAEATRAGGMVTMFLNTDRVGLVFYKEMPEQYLEQEPRFFAEWVKQMNVYISLPEMENPKAILGDVPPARLAKLDKAAQFFAGILNEAKIRLVSVNFPTKEQAANNGLEFATYEKMHWAAVNADYKGISEKATALKQVLQGAKDVKITSPAGTNLSLAIGSRPIFVDDGIVTAEDANSKMFMTRIASLPGGQVFFAPLETSAKGTVTVPKDRCNYKPLTNASYVFENGRMTSFKAETGAECVQETLAAYAGAKDVIGTVYIGLNPALQVIEQGGDYRPANAAGMVWIYTGSNELQGGNNKDPGGVGFPVTNATVTVDGKIVIKDGRLAF